MPRRFLAVAFSVLGVVAFCAIGVYAFMHRFDPPRSWENPPLYPGAENVTVQDYAGLYKSTGEINFLLRKSVNFSVSDPPNKVLAFYKNTLSQERWEISTWNRSVAIPELPDDMLSVEWFSSAKRSPSGYFIDVVIDFVAPGSTNVEIRSLIYPGY
jgi:hypothetical protein